MNKIYKNDGIIFGVWLYYGSFNNVLTELYDTIKLFYVFKSSHKEKRAIERELL